MIYTIFRYGSIREHNHYACIHDIFEINKDDFRCRFRYINYLKKSKFNKVDDTYFLRLDCFNIIEEKIYYGDGTTKITAKNYISLDIYYYETPETRKRLVKNLKIFDILKEKKVYDDVFIELNNTLIRYL